MKNEVNLSWNLEKLVSTFQCFEKLESVYRSFLLANEEARSGLAFSQWHGGIWGVPWGHLRAIRTEKIGAPWGQLTAIRTEKKVPRHAGDFRFGHRSSRNLVIHTKFSAETIVNCMAQKKVVFPLVVRGLPPPLLVVRPLKKPLFLRLPLSFAI